MILAELAHSPTAPTVSMALEDAARHADDGPIHALTRALYGSIYPSHVAAVTAAQYDPDGIASLQKAAAAKLRCVHCGDEDGPWVGTPHQPVCEQCAEKRGAVA